MRLKQHAVHRRPKKTFSLSSSKKNSPECSKVRAATLLCAGRGRGATRVLNSHICHPPRQFPKAKRCVAAAFDVCNLVVFESIQTLLGLWGMGCRCHFCWQTREEFKSSFLHNFRCKGKNNSARLNLRTSCWICDQCCRSINCLISQPSLLALIKSHTFCHRCIGRLFGTVAIVWCSKTLARNSPRVILGYKDVNSDCHHVTEEHHWPDWRLSESRRRGRRDKTGTAQHGSDMMRRGTFLSRVKRRLRSKVKGAWQSSTKVAQKSPEWMWQPTDAAALHKTSLWQASQLIYTVFYTDIRVKWAINEAYFDIGLDFSSL